MCDKIVLEGPFMLLYCPGRYNTKKRCDKVVDNFLSALKFVPDRLVIIKTINFDKDDHENIIYFSLMF